MYVCEYVCLSLSVCICVFECMSASQLVCMCVSMYICHGDD